MCFGLVTVDTCPPAPPRTGASGICEPLRTLHLGLIRTGGVGSGGASAEGPICKSYGQRSARSHTNCEFAQQGHEVARNKSTRDGLSEIGPFGGFLSQMRRLPFFFRHPRTATPFSVNAAVPLRPPRLNQRRPPPMEGCERTVRATIQNEENCASFRPTQTIAFGRLHNLWFDMDESFQPCSLPPLRPQTERNRAENADSEQTFWSHTLLWRRYICRGSTPHWFSNQRIIKPAK